MFIGLITSGCYNHKGPKEPKWLDIITNKRFLENGIPKIKIQYRFGLTGVFEQQ